MRYAPEEWHAEIEKWKSAIRLRMLKAVVAILDALPPELDGELDLESPDGTQSSGTTENHFDTPSSSSRAPSRELDPSSFSPVTSAGEGEVGRNKNNFQLLLLRLAPIRCTEANLRKWYRASIEPKSDCRSRDKEESEETRHVIARCKENIKILWMDVTVRTVLRRRKFHLEESAKL